MAGGTSSAASGESCSDVDSTSVSTGAVDAASLAAVTQITVFSTVDCSSFGNLGAMDAAAQATLGGNEMVTKAIADAGYQGQQIVGYMLDGTSLTVYVKK
jgi:hypothetical protein